MPRRANITIKRKSNSNKDAIDWMEFNNDATKLDKDLQYLEKIMGYLQIKWLNFKDIHFVTLNILNNLTQRKTEMPKGGIISVLVSIISMILPITTKQSNLLNRETK